MDPEQGGVLTIGELSAYLKIPKSTLYKLVCDGKSPSQKVGLQKAAIDRWLGERRGKESAGTDER